ncbi:hypothetical protein [Methanobrevibacter sp. UBA417]|jgi:hypothetical protein|uniref:hypothetical protein n=1 Tax=Methanobrevibacter sp. UBA417 TaxID=1915487 RepID=UPI0039B850B6
MTKSTTHGYGIEYNGIKWVYSDTKEDITDIRPCRYCSKMQTKEGYDGCLGYIPGVRSACCGHGIENPYVVTNDGEYIQFNSVEELKDHSF